MSTVASDAGQPEYDDVPHRVSSNRSRPVRGTEVGDPDGAGDLAEAIEAEPAWILQAAEEGIRQDIAAGASLPFAPGTLAAVRALEALELQSPEVLAHQGRADTLLDGVVAATRLIARLQALGQRWLAAFARPGVAVPLGDLVASCMSPGDRRDEALRVPDELPVDLPRDEAGAADLSALLTHPQWRIALELEASRLAAVEAGCALHIAPITARLRTEAAVDMVEHLPATLAAQQAGELDGFRAAIIADGTAVLSAEQRRVVEERVVPRASAATPAALRDLVKREAIAVDPSSASRRAERAKAGRGVRVTKADDDMAAFTAILKAADAELGFALLDGVAVALTSAGLADGRTLPQLRADVLVDILDSLAETGSAHLDVGAACATGGSPATAASAGSTTVPASTDESLANVAPGADADPADPAETAGAVVDPAETAGAADPPDMTDRADARADSAGRAGPADAAGSAGAAGGVARAGCSAGAAGGVARAGCSAGAAGAAGTAVRAAPGDAVCPADIGADAVGSAGAAGGVARAGSSAVALDPADARSPDDPADAACSAGVAGPSRIASSSRGHQSDSGPRVPRVEPGSGRTPVPATVPGPVRTAASTPAPALARRRRRTGAIVDISGGRTSEQCSAGVGTVRGVCLNVYLPLSTLAGIDDGPAELVGYGVITAETARALAASADTVRALIIDDRPPGPSRILDDRPPGPAREPRSAGVHSSEPSRSRVCGTVLDAGRAVYRPPAAAHDYVSARDRVCQFPGCRTAARRCDLDHRVPYDAPDLGATCPCNLDTLCRHHHRVKTLTPWRAVPAADGRLIWTSPIGRRYAAEPSHPLAAPGDPPF